MDIDLPEQVANLEERVEQIASISEDVLINHLGWLTANQTVLAAMQLHLTRTSRDPETVLRQIGFEAQSLA